MIDAKDYLAPKRFHIVSYVCVIVHFLCGSAFTVVTAVLRDGEKVKFSCSLHGKASTTHRIRVDRACFLRYDQTFNSPLPLYGFVLLSTGSTVLISVIYSLVVRKRVDEIESNVYHERRTDGEVEDQTQNTKCVYVFYFYFVHLVLRALFGIIFTLLQHVYFYHNGFDSKFSCNLSPTDQVTTGDINTQKGGSRNSSSFTCENATASEKSSWGIIVSVLNSIVAFVMFLELIYLLRRFSILNCYSEDGWNDDSKFVTVYLLGKQYNLPERQSLHSNGNHFQEYIQCTTSLLENNTPDGTQDRTDSPLPRITRFETGGAAPNVNEHMCEKKNLKIGDIDPNVFITACNLLNIHQVKGNDWRGLAGKLGYSQTDVQIFQRESNPAGSMLYDWHSRDENNNLENLVKALKKIENHEVIKLFQEEMNKKGASCNY